MKKAISTAFILTVFVICSAQTGKTFYFQDADLKRVVEIKKAKYARNVRQNPDSSRTIEVVRIKDSLIITSETYKRDEPTGKWKFSDDGKIVEFDYTFNHRYTYHYCKDTIPGLKSELVDNDSLNFKAPVIMGGITFYDFLLRNLKYPEGASTSGTMGKVNVGFTITDKGIIENIFVIKGEDVFLVKETVRLISKLKFSSPPMYKEHAKTMCTIISLDFILEDK